MRTLALALACLLMLNGCNKDNNDDSGWTVVQEPTPATTTTTTEVVGIQGDQIINFGATWCPPCQRMATMIQGMIDAKINISHVDIDADKLSKNQYNVNKIPCFVVLKDGKEIFRHYGEYTEAEIKEWIK